MQYNDNRDYASPEAVAFCNEVLESPGVHFFCKDIIKEGLNKDSVDSIRNAELALEVFKRIAL